MASIVSSHLIYCTPNKLDHEELGFLEILSRKAHDWANRRSRDAAAAVGGIEATGILRPPTPAAVAEGAAARGPAAKGQQRPVPPRQSKGSIADPDTALATLRLVAVSFSLHPSSCSPACDHALPLSRRVIHISPRPRSALPLPLPARAGPQRQLPAAHVGP